MRIVVLSGSHSRLRRSKRKMPGPRDCCKATELASSVAKIRKTLTKPSLVLIHPLPSCNLASIAFIVSEHVLICKRTVLLQSFVSAINIECAVLLYFFSFGMFFIQNRIRRSVSFHPVRDAVSVLSTPTSFLPEAGSSQRVAFSVSTVLAVSPYLLSN